LAKFFGFLQFDFAGTLPLADGRYLAGSPEGGDETVLVLQRIGAPPLGERRRRRGRPSPAEPEPGPLPVTRATVIPASSSFENQAEAARWLDQTCEAEETVEALASDALATLNKALHAQAVAAADPLGRQLTADQAERILLAYGSGEQAADSRFTDARQVEATPRTASRRRQREEELRPQERVAAVLRGREELDACETLLLRARADLDAGREREATLQLRVGLEALLSELDGALEDPNHEKDMATLRERQAEAANAAIEETLGICERVLRRRRVLQD
jgi:hypothetical protein